MSEKQNAPDLVAQAGALNDQQGSGSDTKVPGPDIVRQDRGGALVREGAGVEVYGPTVDAGVAGQLRRRREAALRLPPLRCGHRAPFDCQRRGAHA